MKHKLLFIFALLCTVAQGVWADDSGSCGDGVTWSYVADTEILTIAKTGDGTGAMANYYISNQPWYGFNITKVVIEDGVTSIGDEAFFVYPSLLSVEIPASVTRIGASAFYKCTGLTSVSFATGSQLASIDTYAFYYCTNLTSITIPNGVTTISNNAFNSAGLTSIAIPASVTSIGSFAFIGCTNLETITVDEENAKYDSPGDCNAIIDKTSNTLVIGCKGTTIPDNVTSIGNDAFENCTGLTIIEIPSSVTSIGDDAFENCTGLTSVIVHATSVPTLGSRAFDRNASSGRKIYVPYGLLTNYKEAANWSAYSSDILPISDGKCGEDVNYSYDNSTHTLSIFGSGAMDDFAEGGAPWNSYKEDIATVVIGNGVTNIGANVFAGCSALTSITIPKDVTSIGNQAFKGCTSLPSITIPRGVTNIGQSAFADCTSLVSVTFATASQLASIGGSAFNNCRTLTTVVLPSTTPPTLGDDAFSGCTVLNVIGVPIGTASTYKDADNWSAYKDIIYDESCGTGVYYAYDSTSKTLRIFGFGNMYNYASFNPTPWDLYKGEIATVVIGNGVMSIGMYAFNNSTGLTSIEIPASVTVIGNNAFQYCTSLASVTIYAPALTYYGRNAFDSNANDRKIYVFSDCVDTYKSADNWSSYTNGIQPITLTANEGATGEYWTTYYNELANAKVPSGAQAFKVTLSGTTLTLTEISDGIISIREPVVIKSTSASVLLESSTTGSIDTKANALTGTMTAITNPGNAYVLNKKSAGVGFYKLKSTGSIGAHKAYLTYSGAALAREYFLFDEETTGVNTLNVERKTMNGDYYDLQGRKVAQPTKGLYIVNGKIVVIK
jgi:hypothetical protein